MAAPVLLDGLSRIADRYDAVFCDVWGVIHDGRKAFATACEALKQFRAARGPVILVTNAPVPKHRVTRLFAPLGVPDDCFDDVATSGDATRRELLKLAPGPVYRIGLGDDFSLYDDLGLAFSADPAQAAVISCTSLREYPDGLPETYREELRVLAGHGAPMVCANPDIQFRQGDRLIWAAGALAAIYEEFGGRVIRPGKPDAPIYELARAAAAAVLGRRIPPQRILAIGDGPSTDILGAMREGMDSLFIGGGIHGHRLDQADEFIGAAADILAEEQAEASYAMPALTW